MVRLVPILTAAAVTLVVLLLPHSNAAAKNKSAGMPFVVLELFTSQGCSSCPPADQLLRKLAAEARRDKARVFPLSFHVDYWNYIGWRDPYSGKTATSRQKLYAQVMGERGVYTPQMIINGKVHFPGTREQQLRTAISRSLKSPAQVGLTLSKIERAEGNQLVIHYEYTDAPTESLLRVALVNTPDANYVSTGENAGSTLSHTNVVRAFRTLELKAGTGSAQTELGVPPDISQTNLEIICFVQDKSTMHILGASSLSVR